MKLAVVLVACTLLPAARAAACGGVFCDVAQRQVVAQPQVVVQTGERILFAHEADGRLLAYIQIAYQGPASQFSWILPVVGKPELSVGTEAVFTALDSATAPLVGFQLKQDECKAEDDGGGCSGSEATNSLMAAVDLGGGGENGAPPSARGYQPIGAGTTGPYDYVVLPGTTAEAALTWLSQNGYYAPPASADLLRPYLDGRHNLLALRLTSGATAGDIVPVAVHSDEAEPCVPLHLTAVAAQEDMAVLVWILGKARAVPVNYASVEPNLARLDFQRGGTNYDALVAEAVDAAPGGEAFVTEFAGKTPSLAGAGFLPPDPHVTDLLRGDADAVAYLEDVWELASQQSLGKPLVEMFLQEWFPEPESLKVLVRQETFHEDPASYRDAYAAMAYDPQSISDDLERTFLAPLRDLGDVLAQGPYLTRLYTRISPGEMLDDPIFTENRELPDVTRNLTAVEHVVCEGKPAVGSPVRLDLPDGHSLWFVAQQDLVLPLGGPAARRVVRTSSSGAGRAIVDNGAIIDAGHGDPRGCGGCRSSPGAVPWAILTGALVARSFRRRR